MTLSTLHLIDSLATGGAERMAVSLANGLAQRGFDSSLCASRTAGPLQAQVLPQVNFCVLGRRGRFDLPALLQLANWAKRANIQVIHAHTTSVFLGIALKNLLPGARLVWHDHVGQHERHQRHEVLYWLAARQVDAVLTVSRDLAWWAQNQLGLKAKQVHFLPNFVDVLSTPPAAPFLPGQPGARVICIANIRVQKDHLTLLKAWQMVIRQVPQAHLVLVGGDSEPNLAEQARNLAAELGLENYLTWLGPRQDVAALLAGCDIGVMSSISEGFPVTLLEYGRAGLAVAATQVGECADILDGGQAGLLVSPGVPSALSAALIRLLTNDRLRAQLAERLRQRVLQRYSAEKIFQQLIGVYESLFPPFFFS